MNLTPKKRFQESKAHCAAHLELVVSDQFRSALEASLLEQIMAMPMTYDVNEAAAAYNRIMGARDFINHLLNVAEKTTAPELKTIGNLDHSVR